MHVYCTDGTVFECGRYDVNEFGLVLYGQPKPENVDRYDSTDDTQIGFVPHDRLWYVLPRGVTPQAGVAPPQGQGQPSPGQGQPSTGQKQPSPGQGQPSPGQGQPSSGQTPVTSPEPSGGPTGQGRQPRAEQPGGGARGRE